MDFNNVNHNMMMMSNNNQDNRSMSYNDIPAPTPIGMPFGGGQLPNMMSARDRQFMQMAGMPQGGMGSFQNNNRSNDFASATFPDHQTQTMEMMRKRQMGGFDEERAAKRPNFNASLETSDASDFNQGPNEPNLIPASKEGINFYSRNDVLCGRGGGTNVHPGNRRFRDLINANRRAYLKAKKNDKPAISRSIVRTIREMNGRFLKKDEKLGLWFEIGDDGAREKTSQALRQRAPEMKKILFEDEQRQQQQDVLLQRRFMGEPMSNFGQGQSSQMMGSHNFGPSQSPLENSPSGNSNENDISLLARYNMFQQKALLNQEKNLLLQRLAMSGLNPQAIQNQQSNIESMTTQTLLGQGFKQVTPRGA